MAVQFTIPVTARTRPNCTRGVSVSPGRIWTSQTCISDKREANNVRPTIRCGRLVSLLNLAQHLPYVQAAAVAMTMSASDKSCSRDGADSKIS
eukprot:scaffold2760_cov167-Amphora_coffeaeformis.AAC.3